MSGALIAHRRPGAKRTDTLQKAPASIKGQGWTLQQRKAELPRPGTPGLFAHGRSHKRRGLNSSVLTSPLAWPGTHVLLWDFTAPFRHIFKGLLEVLRATYQDIDIKQQLYLFFIL